MHVFNSTDGDCVASHLCGSERLVRCRRLREIPHNKAPTPAGSVAVECLPSSERSMGPNSRRRNKAAMDGSVGRARPGCPDETHLLLRSSLDSSLPLSRPSMPGPQRAASDRGASPSAAATAAALLVSPGGPSDQEPERAHRTLIMIHTGREAHQESTLPAANPKSKCCHERFRALIAR